MSRRAWVQLFVGAGVLLALLVGYVCLPTLTLEEAPSAEVASLDAVQHRFVLPEDARLHAAVLPGLKVAKGDTIFTRQVRTSQDFHKRLTSCPEPLACSAEELQLPPRIASRYESLRQQAQPRLQSISTASLTTRQRDELEAALFGAEDQSAALLSKVVQLKDAGRLAEAEATEQELEAQQSDLRRLKQQLAPQVKTQEVVTNPAAVKAFAGFVDSLRSLRTDSIVAELASVGGTVRFAPNGNVLLTAKPPKQPASVSGYYLLPKGSPVLWATAKRMDTVAVPPAYARFVRIGQAIK